MEDLDPQAQEVLAKLLSEKEQEIKKASETIPTWAKIAAVLLLGGGGGLLAAACKLFCECANV